MSLFGQSIPDFDRHAWPHWMDADRDGEDTRQEVLGRDSLVPVTRNDRGSITHGLWCCPYTGRVITEARKVDVDHVIALGEAHRMGGHAWDTERRRQFANDFDNLWATHRSANRAKSDNDAFSGMPPNIAMWGRYMIVRERVAEKYGLVFSAAEKHAVDFYRAKWHHHQHWVKMGRVRVFLGRWLPGMF